MMICRQAGPGTGWVRMPALLLWQACGNKEAAAGRGCSQLRHIRVPPAGVPSDRVLGKQLHSRAAIGLRGWMTEQPGACLRESRERSAVESKAKVPWMV